jgi:undecaprenyl phosphate-alpha-L-ara4FN deformylase
MIHVGLRIDVDTLRGTRYGIPNLLRLLGEYGIVASFFFSVGPDNMGRHLWRLIRPSFLLKMLRSKAPSLYGWDILFKGTLWPGPVISKKTGSIIHSSSEAGHEIGIHAWDHRAWQVHIDHMGYNEVRLSLKMGLDRLTEIIGHIPVASAAPGWRCSDNALAAKSEIPFTYNSDCRGEDVFYPVISGKSLSQPQIPTTLPTYDEVIGQDGITDINYNEYVMTLIDPGRLNILTIHAEVEGIARLSLFDKFLKMAGSKGISFVPLGVFLTEDLDIISAPITKKIIKGREGWVSCQAKL